MPVLALFTSPAITKEMYESLRTEIGWEANPPPGLVLHAAALDQAGHLNVADVWETAELLKIFVDSRLLPAMHKLQFPTPSVNVCPTFNVNAFSAVQQFLIGR